MDDLIGASGMAILLMAACYCYLKLQKNIIHGEFARYRYLGPFALFLPGVLTIPGRLYFAGFVVAMLLAILGMLKFFGPLP